MFNVDGYFHHLVEYLKAIAAKGFADPLPFIVVDDSNELSVVFRLLKLRYKKGKTTAEAYAATRQLIYELPYFLKKKTDSSVHVEDIIAEMDAVEKQGSAEQKQEQANEIEKAYLEKEIERMYDRLAKTGRDTSIVSDKLTNLKKRKKANKRTKRQTKKQPRCGAVCLSFALQYFFSFTVGFVHHFGRAPQFFALFVVQIGNHRSIGAAPADNGRQRQTDVMEPFDVFVQRRNRQRPLFIFDNCLADFNQRTGDTVISCPFAVINFKSGVNYVLRHFGLGFVDQRPSGVCAVVVKA